LYKITIYLIPTIKVVTRFLDNVNIDFVVFIFKNQQNKWILISDKLWPAGL